MFVFAGLGGEVCQPSPHTQGPQGLPGAGPTLSERSAGAIPRRRTGTAVCTVAGALAQHPQCSPKLLPSFVDVKRSEVALGERWPGRAWHRAEVDRKDGVGHRVSVFERALNVILWFVVFGLSWQEVISSGTVKQLQTLEKSQVNQEKKRQVCDFVLLEEAEKGNP